MNKYPLHLTSDIEFPIEKANINTKTSMRMRSSDGEFVRHVEDLHTRWLACHQDSRERYYDAMQAFMDINGGMWPETERNQLLNADRHPTSINILKQKMETLSGSLMSERFDFDFKALDIDENTLIDSIKHWYFADKDQYKYETADNQSNMSGLLHSGVQMMCLDYDIRRTGAISFKHCTDGTVLSDPFWQDNEIRNWRKAMIDGYLTPEMMIEELDCRDDSVRKLAERDFAIGYDYANEGDDVRAWENLPTKSGSRYLVTEYRWLEKLRTTRLHAKMQTGEWFAFPLKVTEDQVRDFKEKTGITWSDIREFPYEDNILYYGIISPDLTGIAPDLVFVRGKHPTQPGMIGLFEFSSNKMFGIRKGVFEYGLDLNRTLNYRQSKMDDVIAAAASGATFVDQNKVGGKQGVQKIMQNKTRPDYVHAVDGPPDNVAALFPVGQVPEHIFRQVNEIIDLLDRVTPVTPALEGAAERDQSGILLELRHEITKLGTLRLYGAWQQFLMDKAEAWYNQAQISYKDLYRKIPMAGGSGEVEFNVPAFRTNQNGGREKVYINSISDLPRARVVVRLSKSSPTKRMEKRLELFDTTKMLSAHPELFKEEIQMLTYDLLSTIERTPEEQLKIERMRTLKEMRDILSLFTQIEGLKAQGMEAKSMQMQLQGMMQNMQAKMQGGAQQPSIPEQATPAAMSVGPAQEQSMPTEREQRVQNINRLGNESPAIPG